MDLGGYDFTTRSPRSVDQSAPHFLRTTPEKQQYKMSAFEYLYPFQRYSPPNFEVVQNRAKFCMFLALKLLWVKPLKFWTSIIKFGLFWSPCKISRQSADAYQGYRGKTNKTSAVKHKSAPKAIASGQTN